MAEERQDEKRENRQEAVVMEDLVFAYKSQKDKQVLKEISLTVQQGEMVVVMGPSGAGKSTLAHCLNGLIPHFIKGAYGGMIRVMGRNPAKEKVGSMAQDVGLVFQDFESQLFSTNTQLEIVFGPENFNMSREEMSKIMAKILRVVKLEGMEQRHPATLSGGQKQRLAIGSVLAIRPKLICMDEPTTDLDPMGKAGIFQLAEELHQDTDLTLIIVEHETEEALHADRLIIMHEGRIVRDGSADSVLREVEFFQSIGIMPLQIPLYYSRMGVGREQLPMTPEAGAAFFREKGWQMRGEAWQKLGEADLMRKDQYGRELMVIHDLHHTYDNGNTVLQGIDLSIREGEFLAVLGQNGSGKTTLIKHFNGLLRPTKGEVIVDGMNTLQHTIYDIGRTVGYVFQNPDHQIFSDTVFDEVAFSPRMRGFTEGEIKQSITESLQAVDLVGYEQADPFTLTKGERQRVAVASVLAAKPQILILDEPTTGLDYKEQRKMMELVKRLNDNGHTIIIVTHTMWVVAEYAHRVVVVQEGKILLDGTTREVFAREDVLAKSYLRPPHIVRMGNLLGKTVLSVDEMERCTCQEVAE